jgi:hypothetical protein
MKCSPQSLFERTPPFAPLGIIKRNACERRLLSCRLLQDRDHAIDDIIDCSLRWKLRFLTRVLLPIPLGMHAIPNDLVDAVLFFSTAMRCGRRRTSFLPQRISIKPEPATYPSEQAQRYFF